MSISAESIRHEFEATDDAISELHDALLILQRRDEVRNQAVESIARRLDALESQISKFKQDSDRPIMRVLMQFLRSFEPPAWR